MFSLLKSPGHNGSPGSPRLNSRGVIGKRLFYNQETPGSPVRPVQPKRKRKKTKKIDLNDYSLDHRRDNFIGVSDECTILGHDRSLPTDNRRAIQSCGPFSVEFILSYLRIVQGGSPCGTLSCSPCGSPPRARREYHAGGLTNQRHVASMLEECGLNPTIVLDKEITEQWRLNFEKKALSTLNNKRCIMFSVEHPHLAGHWLVMLRDYNDTMTNEEYACVYDSYTGNVWKLPWSLLNTWFKRDDANEDYVPESVVTVA